MRAIPVLEVVFVVVAAASAAATVVVVVLSVLKATVVDFVSHLEDVAQGHRFGLGFDPVWFVVRCSTPMDRL